MTWIRILSACLKRFVVPFLTSCLLIAGQALNCEAQMSQPPIQPPPQSSATIVGTVTTEDGTTVVSGATVLLKDSASRVLRSTVSNDSGFFTFAGVPSGTYSIVVTGNGFSSWTKSSLSLEPGEYYEVPNIILAMASATSTVRVTASRQEIAEAQMREEEKQRVLGIVPNFYVSYDPDAVPLSAGQKIRLATRTSIDPLTLLSAGFIAGAEQSQNYFPGFGQGLDGYAKRLGAAYADDWSSTMMADALLPALFHQDPRYFYRGTGSAGSRALDAISSVFVCRGDNGKQEPNYSYILGGFAAGGLSNLYYPASDRGIHLAIDNGLLNIGTGAGVALLEEFVLRRFTHRPQSSSLKSPDDQF